MFTIRTVVAVFLTITIAAGAGEALSQSYPNKPIRIVTGSTGSSNDSIARMIGQGISGNLGQPIIVENRPTIVTAETVAKALPDGYTLLVAGDIIWVGPLLLDPVSRARQPDVLRDFAPISMLGSAPCLVVVHPTFPVKTLQELIALAKSRPGELNYGKSTPGGTPHLGAEMLNTMAGIKLVPIPYKGSGDIATALIANQIHVAVISYGSAIAGVKSGRLKALAVTSLKPSAMAPGLPTVTESGLPGYEVVGIDAMYAPAKTPTAIINRLNQETVRFLETADAREKYMALGAEVVASSPKEHAEKIKTQIVSMSKVIKAAGIKLD